MLRDDGLHLLEKRLGVLQPRLRCREPFIALQVVGAKGVAQVADVIGVEFDDNDVAAIFGLEPPAGDRVRPFVHEEFRHWRRTDQHRLHHAGVRPETVVHERGEHLAPLARAFPVEQPAQHRTGRRRRGSEIAQPHRQRDRIPVFGAQFLHDAGPGIPCGRIEPRSIPVRPVASKAVDRSVDDLRIDRLDVLVGMLQRFLHRARGVRQKDIGTRRELVQGVLGFRLLEIQLHRFLGAVLDECRPRHLAGRQAGGHVPEPPGIAAERLDLDDLRTEIGEDHRRVRRRSHRSDLDHPDTFKNSRNCLSSLVAATVRMPPAFFV